MTKERQKGDRGKLAILAKHGRVGLEFAFKIIGAFTVGYILDSFFKIFPVLTLASLLFGLFMSLFSLYRSTK